MSRHTESRTDENTHCRQVDWWLNTHRSRCSLAEDTIGSLCLALVAFFRKIHGISGRYLRRIAPGCDHGRVAVDRIGLGIGFSGRYRLLSKFPDRLINNLCRNCGRNPGKRSLRSL